MLYIKVSLRKLGEREKFEKEHFEEGDLYMAVYSYDHQFILSWSNVYYIGDSLVHLHLKVTGSAFSWDTELCPLPLYYS